MRTTSKLLIAPLLVLLVVLPFVATRSYAASVVSNTSSFTLALKPNFPNSFLLQDNGSTSPENQANNESNDLNNVTAMINNENDATINSLPLGWKISAIVHEIIAWHKEEVENITLVRRLFLNETKNLRLQLINETRTAIRLQMQNITQEMEKLREKYLAGNITREEYLMQMFRLRLRYREEIRKLITLEKEIQKLNKKISEENKELAKNLIAINKDFAEQMKEIHDDVRQLIDATKNMKRGMGKP
jgi:hypothetical protein